jgi:hypothetical protein
MPETVFYMRNAFPFIGRGIPDGLLSDAKVLLELQTDQIGALVAELGSIKTFLDRATFNSIVKSFVPNDQQAQRLGRLILHMDESLRQTDWGLDGLFSRLAEAMESPESKEKPLPPHEFDELKRRLTIVVKPYLGLKMQAKAKRLSEVTGQRLEQLEIICDLRPVFDDNREVVEGMIPLTILKIVTTGADGLPIAMEAVLSQCEVAELAKKSEAALKKLGRLQTLLAEKNISIPQIPIVKERES